MKKAGEQALLKGVALVILAEMLLVVTGVLIRMLTDQLPVAQVVFLRNAIGLIFVVILVFRGEPISLNTTRLPLHLLRALVGVSAMSCLYYGWTHLPLSTAALLKQTSPLFMPLLALWFLKESIPRALLFTLPLGFLGVFIILNPNAGVEWALLVGLMGALLGGLAKIVVRSMKGSEPPTRIVFYFSLFAAMFSFPFAINEWAPMNSLALVGVILIAALSTLAQLAMTGAYHCAPAGYLGPFTYSSVIMAAIVGWLIWDETLTLMTLVGMLFIMASSLMTARIKFHNEVKA